MVDSNKKLIQRGVSSIEDTETAINEKAREEYVEAQDAVTLEAAKAYTDTQVAALVDGAPETLDTLKEIAEVLKANEDGAAAMLEVIGTKADAATVAAALAGKVDKVEGKSLSSNDYTADEKAKLAGLDNYTLPAATADNLGGVKAGTNVEIDAEGRLSATAAPYELPTASSTVLGGVKIGDNLTIDADGRLNAPAGGGGSGGGGDCATIFMPWVEPIFDTDPNIPTNQQAFIDAWGPAIAKYSAAPERSRLVINVPFFEVSFKMDCQALPDTEIEAGIVGYTLAATAIVPMAPDGVNVLGLRNYMSSHITIASGVITSVDSFLMSAMMNMETGLPNYLLDSASGVGGGGGSVVIDITDVSTSEAGVFDETQIKAAVQPHVATLIANPETRVMIRSGAILLPATAGATASELWISSLETNPASGGDVQNVHVLVVNIYCRIKNGVIQTAVGGRKAHDLATDEYVNAKIKDIQPDYTSLVEQLVPGEFWLCADGITRQVYVRTFRGTMPAGVSLALASGIYSIQYVSGDILEENGKYRMPFGSVHGHDPIPHGTTGGYLATIYVVGGDCTAYVSYSAGGSVVNSLYSITLKYTKV